MVRKTTTPVSETKHEAERSIVAQADADYDAHKLNPNGARLSWGSYSMRGGFHFLLSDYQHVRKRSDGGWLCNTCFEPAQMEHDKPECHRCSDWNGCGTDCTLSRIHCKDCGTSLSFA
jgi:hypothetical protein